MQNSPDCVGCLSTLTAKTVTYVPVLSNITAAPTTLAVSTSTKTYPPNLLTSSFIPSTFTTTFQQFETTPTMLTTIKANENFPCCVIITYQKGKKPATKVCPCPTTTNQQYTDTTKTSKTTSTATTTSNLLTTLTSSKPTSVTNTKYTSTKSSSVLTTTVPTTPLAFTSTKPTPTSTTMITFFTNSQLTTTVDTTTPSTTDSSITTSTPAIMTSTSTDQQLTTAISDVPTTTFTTETSLPPVTTKQTETSQSSSTAVSTEDTISAIITTTKPSFDVTAEPVTQSTSATTTSSVAVSDTLKTNTVEMSTLTTRTTSTEIASLSTNAAPTSPNVVNLEKTSTAPLQLSTSTNSNSGSTAPKMKTTTTVEKDSVLPVVSSAATVGVTDAGTTTTKVQTTTKTNDVFSISPTASTIFETTTSRKTTKENTAIKTSASTLATKNENTDAATQRNTKEHTTTMEFSTHTMPDVGNIGNIVSTSSKKPNTLTTVVTSPKQTILQSLTTSKTTTEDATTTKVLTTVSSVAFNQQTPTKTSTESSYVTSAKTTTLPETTEMKAISTSVSSSSKQTSSVASSPDSTVKTTVLPIESSTISSTEKSVMSTTLILPALKTTVLSSTTQQDETVTRLLTTIAKSNPTETISSKMTTLPVTQSSKPQSTEKGTSLPSTKPTNVKTTNSGTTTPIVSTRSVSTVPSTTKPTIIVPTTNATKQSTVFTSKSTRTTTKTIATSELSTTATTTTVKPLTTTQSETTAAPCECANSGVCNENGTCSCPDGYFGENCDDSLPSPSVAAATTAVTVALAASQSSSSKLKYLWPRYSASVRSPTTPHEFFRLLATYWLTVALGINSMFGIPSSADIKNLPKCSMAYLFGTGAFFFSLTAMLFEAGVDALTLSGMRFNAWTRPAERRPRCFPFWPTFSLYVLVGVAPTAGLWLKHWTSCVTPRSCIGSLGYIYGDYDQDIKNASWLQLTITVFYVAMAMTLGILAIACNKFDVCRCRRRTEAWSINPYIYGREIWPLEANAFLWLVAIQPLLFALSWISYIYVNDMKTSLAQWINLIITSIYSVTSTVASALTTSQELSGTVMSALTTLPPRFMGIMPTLDHVSLRDKDNIKQVQMRPEEWEKCKQKELNGGPLPVYPVRMEILPSGLVDYMCHLWTLAYIRLRDNGASSESAIATLTNAFLQQKPDLRNINVFTFALLFANWVNEVREKDSNAMSTSMIRKSRAIIDRRLDINKPPPMLVVKEHRNDIVYRKRVPHLTPIFSGDENKKTSDTIDNDVVDLNEIHPSFVGPHCENNAASALIPRKLVSAYMKDFSMKENQKL
uniref:EGF-like domain-containing protein n=1 Tax=Panagrellus redivivus TaxID=6233 RepID=A0A7E4ZU01_PANRE